MKVYKTHIGFKIFGFLFSMPAIIVCSGILLVPFIPVPSNTAMKEMQNSWPPLDFLLYLIPICLTGIIIFSFIILISSFMKKITINDKVIILSNGFISKKIDFKKIEDAYVEFFNLCFETKN